MKFDWFSKTKHKDLPDFWNHYIASFQSAQKKDIDGATFVAFDTETTGFHQKKDRILSIGAIKIEGNQIAVQNSYEVYLHQNISNPESIKIHGILPDQIPGKMTELEAIQSFLAYIKNHVLVGHHIGFDVGMINQMLERHQLPKLQNKCIDTALLFHKTKHKIYESHQKPYPLDELCDMLSIPKNDRHTASGDALLTAIVFLKTLNRLQKNKALSWKDLLSA